ncbi:hypothetical protein QQP08_002610 [Theobroma cacao]|nr:hypothetical protein QQP08_002610 [Theobroma cacao]
MPPSLEIISSSSIISSTIFSLESLLRSKERCLGANGSTGIKWTSCCLVSLKPSRFQPRFPNGLKNEEIITKRKKI